VTKTLTHEPDAKRYVLRENDEIASLVDYAINGNAISMTHTYTNPKLRGRGLAGEIVEFAVNDIEATTPFHIVPMCWYVAKWFDENPDRVALLTRPQKADPQRA
jgi:predicted GNAT family acetyltransferase